MEKIFSESDDSTSSDSILRPSLGFGIIINFHLKVASDT